MARVNVGDCVPDVAVQLENGPVRLRDLTSGQNVVLYFYPKDGSFVCVQEARAFNDLLDDFHAANTQVIGVSMDDRASHARFAAAEKLRFPSAPTPTAPS